MNVTPTTKFSNTAHADAWQELISGSVPAFAEYLTWQKTQWGHHERSLQWWQTPTAQLVHIYEEDSEPSSAFGAGDPADVAQLLAYARPPAQHLTVPIGTWDFPSIDRNGFGDVACWDLLLARHINEGVTPPHFGGEIVEFQRSELAEVAQFQAEVYPSARFKVDRPDTRWFGLRFQGIIDCVIGSSGWDTSECVHLGSFATRPSARGRGIGTAVMAHVSLTAIQQQGAVSLGVYRENRGAIALYHRLGFHTIFQADSLHYAST